MSGRKPTRRRRFGRVYSRKWSSGRTTWSAQWYCRVTGRRLTRAFDSKKEAAEFLGELERRLLIERYEPPPTHLEARQEDEAGHELTFVDYAAHLLEHRLRAVLAPATITLYAANLKALRGFYGARGRRAAVPLSEVTASSFLDYRAWRKGRRNSSHGNATTVSAATVNRDQQFASRVLREAVVDGHIDANPLAGLRKLKERHHARRYFTKPEITRLLLSCDRHLRPLIVAAVYSGARKSELLALRWADIDFAGERIAIRRTKNGTTDQLALHPHLVSELRATRRGLKAPRPDDHVFLNSRREPWKDIRKAWKRALGAAGLGAHEGLTFHSLRHSFATFYLDAGGNVRDLQSQLGHSDLSTTERYAAALSERRREGVMSMRFEVRRKRSVRRRHSGHA